MNTLSVLEHKEVIREFWREWFSAYRGREVFYRRGRVYIDTSKAFLNYINWCRIEGAPCYCSVQPFKELNRVASIEQLFFDFDSENKIVKAWREAIEFADVIKRYYDAEPLVCYSGRKGYHVRVWLRDPIEFNSQGLAKRFYRIMQEKLLKGLEFETLDRQVIGDIKRLSRVPYTIHEKTGNPCIPITKSHTPLLLTSLTPFRRRGLSQQFVDLCLKEAERKERKCLRVFKSNLKGIRPCLLDALHNPQLDHKVRVAIVAEAYRAGLGVKEIEELFLSQSDFSLERTEYQIKHIIEGGYKPFRRSTLKDLGVCHGVRCGLCLQKGRVVP